MSAQYFTRVYFSRYFFSTYRSNLSRYTKFSVSNFGEPFYFYSDPYVYNRQVKKPEIALNFSGNSIARNFFFKFGFSLGNNFYDYSWVSYKTNNEFFKKFIISFIKFHFKLIFFYEYNLLITREAFCMLLSKKLW